MNTGHLSEAGRAEVERLIEERNRWRVKFDEAYVKENVELARLYYLQCSLLFCEIQTYFMGAQG